jgi:hypothetical protein
MSNLVSINSFKTDSGTLGRNGSLGYRDYIVSLDPYYKDWDVWGIHGDSEISLHCHEPILLCGGLNGTAVFYDRSPRVRFFIDDVPFGESEQRWQTTDPIVLPQGNHTLRTRLVEPARNINQFWVDGVQETLAHTVWAFKQWHPHQGRELATQHNTLFVSAVAFGTETETKTKLFRKSAEEHNIPIEFFDAGRSFVTFFEHKIQNFLSKLEEWKARGREYVFSLDSRDIVFRHPVEIILGKFNAIYEGRVIIAKDLGGVVHPLFAHWLPGHLQQIAGKHCEINSGVIAGHVDDLIKVYSNIVTLREEYLQGIAINDLTARLSLYQKKHPPHHPKLRIENDDQALHFLNLLAHPEWYQIDGNKTLSAFISDFPAYPRLCDPPHKLNAIGSASILHASCPATRGQWEKMCAQKWWEEEEKKREGIPIQVPALEINVAYTCNLQCEYCSNLGRYVKGIVPYEEIKQGLDSWKNKLLPCTVRISGGEPCLHPELDRVVYAVHETWPEAERTIVTNGLIDLHTESFLQAAWETKTSLGVSIHHDNPRMLEIMGANVSKWQSAGLTVVKNFFTYHWRKCYRLDGGKPVPYDSDPQTAYEHCRTQRNSITLRDNNLYLCPQAALFQYAYNNKYVGEEWKLAADYRPLPPTCTWRELADFVDCPHEQAICRMCPDRQTIATPHEKANCRGQSDNKILALFAESFKE